MNGPARAPATLHVTNAYHATSGGVRTFYRALLETAEAAGRRLDLVVPSPGRVVETERVGSSTAIHHVPAPAAPGFDRRYRLLHPGHYVGRGAAVSRLLHEVRPDIVEICDKYSVIHAARLVRRSWYWSGPRPTVVAASFERMDDNVEAYIASWPWLRRAAHAYLRYAYVHAVDAHIANSEYTAEELRRSAGAPHVEVCGMGVDAARFTNAAADPGLRRRLIQSAGGSAEGVLVLYAGRLSPEKHLHFAVEAVGVAAARPGAPDVRLVMAGEGPARHSLAHLAARLAPGRVAFLGNIGNRDELATLYASADVFVHPNPREPFGIGPVRSGHMGDGSFRRHG